MSEITGTLRPIRLAAVAASPVYYQSPLYRQLARDPRVELTVLFASSAGVRAYDAEFAGREVVWDEDQLAGYRAGFARAADRNDILGGFFALRDFDICRRVLSGRYDVVWVHGLAYLTLWLAVAAAWLRRVPVLLREEQNLLRRRSLRRRLLRAPILRVLFHAVSGLCIGTGSRRHFERYGMPARRLFDVPYCVDNDALRAQAQRLAPRRAEIRRSFGIEDERPVVLLVAKLIDRKQPMQLLEAFRQVRRRRECALLLVGEGTLEPELRRLVAESAVADVHFAGFLNRSEIVRAYAAADLFTLPSLDEPWGIAVNEAMNFSLPIVISDAVGCGADLVRDGENGFVVPCGDVAALGAAIERLLADPALRRRFAARSRELVAGWSCERAAEGVIAACQAAMRRRARPLRVAFMPLLPASNAATRAFCERPLSHLAERGIEGRLLAPSGARAYELLCRRPGRTRRLRAAVYWYGLVAPRRAWQMRAALACDVVFIQRGLLRYCSPPVLEWLLHQVGRRLLGRRVVYHLDDALYEVARRSHFSARFRWADLVLTGSEEVAAQARRHSRSVMRLEGGVPVERYPVRRHQVRSPVVLGWTGHAAEEHLAPIVPALVRLARMRPIVVHLASDRCDAPPGLERIAVHRRWEPGCEFSFFADLDIGLMPLADSPLNRGKEGFKLKEYMAAGLPVVCSPVGENAKLVEHGVNGFLACGQDEWVAFLTQLVDDHLLRARMGGAGRRLVASRWTSGALAERLADVLLHVTDEATVDSTPIAAEAA